MTLVYWGWLPRRRGVLRQIHPKFPPRRCGFRAVRGRGWAWPLTMTCFSKATPRCVPPGNGVTDAMITTWGRRRRRDEPSGDAKASLQRCCRRMTARHICRYCRLHGRGRAALAHQRVQNAGRAARIRPCRKNFCWSHHAGLCRWDIEVAALCAVLRPLARKLPQGAVRCQNAAASCRPRRKTARRYWASRCTALASRHRLRALPLRRGRYA